MEGDDEIRAAPAVVPLDLKAYAKTATMNLISRASSLNGLQNIFMQLGRCIIREQAVVRGDLARITLGKCCYISQGVVLQPPPAMSASGLGFLPLTMGDYVRIGKECVIQAASIGSCVSIGEGAILGERCIVKDCVQIEPGTFVPADTVIPPFTIWSGNPCQMVDVLCESYPKLLEWDMEENFSKLAPS